MRNVILLFAIICLTLPFYADLFGQEHENVEQVGSLYSFWSRVFEVDVQGDFAYVATGTSGLQIMDISDPDNPRVVGYYADAPKAVRHFAVSGGIACIAMGNLHIVDVSNPEIPELLSLFEGLETASSVSLSGGNAFVGDYHRGLSIVDISSPHNPREVGNVEGLEDIRDVAISGDLAYVVNETGGLHIIDVSTPENPEEIGLYQPRWLQNGWSMDARAIVVRDTLAFIAEVTRGLVVLDISDPENPDSVSIYNGDFIDLEIAGDIAYVVDSHWRRPYFLRVIDIGNPTNPQWVGSTEIGGPGIGIAVSDQKAYVTFEQRKSLFENTQYVLEVHDVTDPHEIQDNGTYVSEGWADQVILDEEYAYLFAGYGGFRIVDFSSPQNPQGIGALNTQFLIRDGAINDRYVYLANYINLDDGVLLVVDISNCENPTLVASGGAAEAVSVAVSDQYAYLSNHHNGLLVYDISDPENTTLQNSHRLGEGASDIYISGSYTYIADAEGDLSILDLTNPEEAILVGSYETPGSARSITVNGGIAYIADGEEGLCIVDVSNPDRPEGIGFYDTPGEAIGVTISGDYALVADNLEGLRVINISDPENPHETGHYNTPGYAIDVAVQSNLAFVADGIGLNVYDCSVAMGVPVPIVPNIYTLLPAYPNPFNSSTTISFGLPISSFVSLQVYNPVGQKIHDMFYGYKQAGFHSVNMNAGDLQSGLFFVKLESNRISLTQKIILAR